MLYETPAAPLEPPVRFTLTVSLPALCATESLADESATEPAAVDIEPCTVTVCEGVFRLAPLTLLSTTANVLLPAKALRLNATVTDFAEASPAFQLNVPAGAVYTAPAVPEPSCV